MRTAESNMDVIRCAKHRTNKQSFLQMSQTFDNPSVRIALILALAGVAINSVLTVPLYANLVLHLGAACSIIGLYTLGLRWALFISVISSIPLGIEFGNWFVLGLLIAEILFVATLRNRQWSIIYADLTYWLALGTPFTYVAFILFNPEGQELGLSVAIKQAINGLLYVSIASLVLSFIPEYWKIEKHKKKLPRMRQVIQTKLATTIIGISILVGILASKYAVDKQEESLNTRLKGQVQGVEIFVDSYLGAHKTAIQNFADQISNSNLENRQIKAKAIKQDLHSFQSNYQGFISLLMTDIDGGVIHAAPKKFDEMLKSTASNMSVSNRHYFINAMRNESLYVSPVFQGRGFGNDMIVAVSTPYYLSNKQKPSGIVEGSLNLTQLKAIEEKTSSSSESSVIILDSNSHVIYASALLKLKELERFTPTKPEEEFTSNIPITIIGEKELQKKFFYQQRKLSNGWQVYVVESPRGLIKGLEYYYVFILGLVIIFSVFSHYLSRYLSAVIAKPIEKISTLYSQESPLKVIDYDAESNSTLEAYQLFKSLERSRKLQFSFQQALEQKVEEQTKMLVLTNEKLRETTRVAEQSNRLKSEFLANMSHEIRTPMNGVIGMLSLLSGTRLTQEQSHKIKIAKSSADSLLLLINDVLDLSKIEAGKLQLESTDFDLIVMLSDLVETFGVKAEASNIELVLDMSEIKQRNVMGDPTRLRQVVTNLLGNAIKFTKQGSVSVVVRLDEGVGGNYRLYGKVIDTGIGISKDKFPGLFDAFSQVDASTTRLYGGTGLGLTISQQICQMMNGSIQFVSKVGEGSEFSFEVDLASSNKKTSKSEFPNLQGQTIHSLESSYLLKHSIKKQLVTWGAKVELVATEMSKLLDGFGGKNEDTELFNSLSNSNGLIIELHSNKTQTFELIRELRATQKYDSVPLFLLGSINELQLLTEAEYFSIDSFLTKPVTLEKLEKICPIIQKGRSKERHSKGQSSEQAQFEFETNQPVSQFGQVSYKTESIASFGFDFVAWPETASVLVVEDNITNQEVISGILQSFNISMQLAENGEQAIKKLIAARSKPFDLIIMDCQMPVMDGYLATRKIRNGEAGEYSRDIKIMAMTANAMAGDREKCIESGMNDYLNKPIDVEKFYQKLSKWMPNTNALSSQDSGFECSSSDNLKAESESQISDKELLETNESSKKSKEIKPLMIWNEADASRRMLGKTKLIQVVVKGFLKEASSVLGGITKFFDENETVLMLERVHTFKGMSANVSAEVICDTAKQIEVGLKQNELTLTKDLVEKLQQDFVELEPYLVDYLKESS